MATTIWQQRLLAQVENDASAHAAAAEARLVARLGSPDVRKALASCCPSAASASPAEVARRLRAELAASEVVSAFNARDPGTPHALPFWFGPSLHEAENSTTFDNLWSVWLRENENGTGTRSAFGPLDDLEVGLYGLKAFTSRGSPSDPTEARERERLG
jgi:hypothetical protein